jgi:hypothetical protein
MRINFLAILCLVMPSLCFADDYTSKALKVLELLELKDQKFDSSFHPEFNGLTYEQLLVLAANTSSGTQAWIDDALRRPPPTPLSDAIKKSGKAVVDERIVESLRNKIDLFVPGRQIKHDAKSVNEAREALDFAFEVFGVNKSATFTSKEFPQFNGLPLYDLVMEAWLHADTNTFVNPINFIQSAIFNKKQKNRRPWSSIIDGGVGEIQFYVNEFLQKYSKHMSSDYTASLIQRTSRQVELKSTNGLMTTARKYKAGILFLGHGSKGQFKDVAATLKEIDRTVAELDKQYGKGQWFAVFGGDGFNAEKPDIAHVMKHLKDAHGVPIMAIQSDVVVGWGGVDKYIDYVHYVPTHQIPQFDASGAPVMDGGKQKTKIHWVGLIDGVPKGPTATYLGAGFVDGANPILKGVVVAGGGPITLDEVRYAHDHGVPVHYIRAESKFPEVNGQYGSVDDWAGKSLLHGPSLGSLGFCGGMLAHLAEQAGKIQPPIK